MQLTKYKFNSMTIIENKYSYLNIKKNYDRASPSNNLVCLSCVLYPFFPVLPWSVPPVDQNQTLRLKALAHYD